MSDEIPASAGSRSSKRKLANSASAGSESYIGLGDPSASAGGPARGRWSDLSDEGEYEGMPVIHFSEAGEYSSEGESEDEVGTTCWATFKPVASKRVENPYPAIGPPFLVLYFRRQLESPFLVAGW